MRKMLANNQMTVSSLALVVANLVPLVGVFWLGWDAFSLVLLFWLENVVIGFFNILRMATAQGDGSGSVAKKLFMIPFFTFHYGFFTLAQGVLLFAIFGKAAGLESTQPGEIPAIAWQQVVALGLGWTLLTLFASHGVSFLTNTLAAGEYKQAKVDRLMGRPYGRVVIMQFTVLFGGFLAQMTGSNRWALLVLVVAKLVVDLSSHQKERKIFAGGSDQPTGTSGRRIQSSRLRADRPDRDESSEAPHLDHSTRTDRES